MLRINNFKYVVFIYFSLSSILSNSDLTVKVATATLDEIDQLKDGSAYISFIQTTRETEAVKKLTQKK